MKLLPGMLLVGAVLTACVSAPTITPAESRLASGNLGLGGTKTPAISDTWWHAFGDVQLDSLIDQALHGSPTLAAALARMRQAQAELSMSRAVSYPQVSVDGQETRQRFSENYIIPPPFGGSTDWIGTAQAKLDWSLDFWGKQSAMVAMAQRSAEAAELDMAAARLALAGVLTQTYIDLARSCALRDLAAATVKQRASILELTNTRVRNGLESTTAQKNAEVLLALARADRIRADSNLELTRHQIAALIGRGADVYATIREPGLNLDVIPLPPVLPADLLARRADIQAARARIDAALSGRDVARKAFYPDMNIAAFAGWSSIGLDQMFSASARTYGAGPAIHLPVFDAGELRAQYAGATAALDAAVADYNGAVIDAVKQTADTLTQLRTLQEQAAEQGIALDAARESFRLAEIRYRNGIDAQLNVLDAETTLLEAERRSTSLHADIKSQRVALLMAFGGGFELADPLQENTQ
ncbi:MAG: efflux transporter outer membrane subunit [Gammaproteobacteria bacterium]|jgi:NodT family efflux transporter outer membrane factor (OMF) lipoprotein|nr:efflux transporter outer membrane subunit [Gammaproteobacteria bacterium]MBK7520949.1 efflux transporter outer membrane subunit [Gammaproteobacteria bacterium]MBP6226871.1 efflux transporter outer membrane subunit [Pseudomonadales bacterium]